MIPLTYNIAYGVIAGVFSYVLINGTAWLVSKISGGRIVPPNYAASEAWVIPPGGVVPTWMSVVFRSLISCSADEALRCTQESGRWTALITHQPIDGRTAAAPPLTLNRRAQPHQGKHDRVRHARHQPVGASLRAPTPTPTGHAPFHYFRPRELSCATPHTESRPRGSLHLSHASLVHSLLDIRVYAYCSTYRGVFLVWLLLRKALYYPFVVRIQ